MIFPFITSGSNSFEYSIQEFLNTYEIKGVVKGYIEHDNEYYVFIHVDENPSCDLVTSTIDEICNYKQVLNNYIHTSVSNFFINNYKSIYLFENENILPIPQVLYQKNLNISHTQINGKMTRNYSLFFPNKYKINHHEYNRYVVFIGKMIIKSWNRTDQYDTIYENIDNEITLHVKSINNIRIVE